MDEIKCKLFLSLRQIKRFCVGLRCVKRYSFFPLTKYLTNSGEWFVFFSTFLYSLVTIFYYLTPFKWIMFIIIWVQPHYQSSPHSRWLLVSVLFWFKSTKFLEENALAKIHSIRNAFRKILYESTKIREKNAAYFQTFAYSYTDISIKHSQIIRIKLCRMLYPMRL